MKKASSSGDPDGSPRLHGDEPCGWLAGGRVEPEAGWHQSEPVNKSPLDGDSHVPDSEIQSHCGNRIPFQDAVKHFFQASVRKMEKRQTAGEEAAAPLRRSSGPRSASSDAAQAAEPLEIESEALLAGRGEIRIRHRGEVYRLTLTRAGKLILHK